MRKLILFFIALFFLGAIWQAGTRGDKTDRAVQAAAQPAVAKVDPSDPVKAAKCKAALDELSRTTGAWRSYKMDEGDATVEVGPAFYEASFDDKRMINRGMLCVLSEGRADASSVHRVDYLDYRTHKEVAAWSYDLGLSVN